MGKTDGVIKGPSSGARLYGKWFWYDVCFTVCEFLYFSWKKTKQKSGTCWPISLKESLSTDTGRVHEHLLVAVVVAYLHWWFISKVVTQLYHTGLGVKKSKS